MYWFPSTAIKWRATLQQWPVLLTPCQPSQQFPALCFKHFSQLSRPQFPNSVLNQSLLPISPLQRKTALAHPLSSASLGSTIFQPYLLISPSSYSASPIPFISCLSWLFYSLPCSQKSRKQPTLKVFIGSSRSNS